MLAPAYAIKSRLQALPALGGWSVRVGSEGGERQTLPALDLRCAGARVADSKSGAVQVAPQWLLTLVVARGQGAAEQLDAAMAAVIAALHGWVPGEQGARRWDRLTLVSITEPTFFETGQIGYEMSFDTQAVYLGAAC